MADCTRPGEESQGEIYAEAERFLGVVKGVMKIYFNTVADVRLKGIYGGPNGGGVTFNVARVKAPPDPTAADFLDLGEGGITNGAKAIQAAQKDDDLADALSVLGTPIIEWWQIYIALEHLVNHYSTSVSDKGKKQDGAFDELDKLHGVPSGRIKDLHQTANYYRHAAATLPKEPWNLLQAAEFTKRALRRWVLEQRAGLDQDGQPADPDPRTK